MMEIPLGRRVIWCRGRRRDGLARGDARRRNDDASELRARGVERARIPAREREGTRERATNGEAGRTRDDDDDDDARDTHARRGGEGVRGIRDIDGRRAG